jgi:hypothetical protein
LRVVRSDALWIGFWDAVVYCGHMDSWFLRVTPFSFSGHENLAFQEHVQEDSMNAWNLLMFSLYYIIIKSRQSHFSPSSSSSYLVAEFPAVGN